jgi:hypothetical protein
LCVNASDVVRIWKHPSERAGRFEIAFPAVS